MKILGTICARKGSKGVPNKNIREINGIPLIGYSIRQLKKWNKCDRIICSTDSKEIARIAEEYGAEVPFLRPKELAEDNSPKVPVIRHALKFAEENYNERYNYIVDLDPTAPLRKVEYIDGAFNRAVNTSANVVFTGCVSRKNPYFNQVEPFEYPFVRLSKSLDENIVYRQSAPKVFDLNGSVYVYNREYLIRATSIYSDKSAIYEMPEKYSVDIDNEIDFQFVKYLIEEELFQID